MSLTLQRQSKPLLAKLNEDYPKIKNITNEADTNGLINYLLAIINIKIDLNNPSEVNHLKTQGLVILDFIKSKFGMLTIPEIKEAFKMYIAKDFPEIKVYRILDCVVVGEILSAYKDFSTESLRIYDSKKRLFLEQKIEITELEKKTIREEFLKKIFDDLKTRNYSDDLWITWENEDKTLTDFAKKVNSTITVIEKKILYKTEEELYLKELKNEQLISRRSSAKIIVNDFVRQMNTNKKNGTVINRCRNIIASKYLNKFLTDFEQFKKEI